MAGGGTGVEEPTETPIGAKLRRAAEFVGMAPHMASILFPRLYRTRIWHCVGGGGACHAVGPSSTKWNGIAFRPLASAASGEAEAVKLMDLMIIK